ncbi:hypothetical protein GCM10022224_034800 [Nonomuraea antimicrobica]|uniref:Glycosyl hydrolases family 16 n=1 Tax=Nonomuraea antimicrobica TaxID=561173 RepID=A0ABP7BQZ6_9ACTN
MVVEPLGFTTVVLLLAGGTRPVSVEGFAWHDRDVVTEQSPAFDRRAARSRPPASYWFRLGWFERAEFYIDGEIGAAESCAGLSEPSDQALEHVRRAPHADRPRRRVPEGVLPRLSREPDITRYMPSLRIAPLAARTAMPPATAVDMLRTSAGVDSRDPISWCGADRWPAITHSPPTPRFCPMHTCCQLFDVGIWLHGY